MACALVPLDELQVTEPGPAGKAHALPALVSPISDRDALGRQTSASSREPFSAPRQHPDRKEERCFLPYRSPPESGSPAEVEEFLEHAKFITEDLEWLLALPHDKFWCQVGRRVHVQTSPPRAARKQINDVSPPVSSARWCSTSPCRGASTRTCTTLLAASTWPPRPPPRRWSTRSAPSTGRSSWPSSGWPRTKSPR